jgi:hypothetical protein
MGMWEYLSSTGLAEPFLRLGTHTLLVALILIIAWGLRTYYLLAQSEALPENSSQAVNGITENLPAAQAEPSLPFFRPQTGASSAGSFTTGVRRQASLHTAGPSRPRLEAVSYIVQPGDTLFGIAVQFGIQPETLLWANQLVLGDNPHNLRPGQELIILPVDGIYHRWSAGDSLIAVAKFFGVRPEDIVNFPDNHLDPATLGELDDPNIPPGTWLIIPGGRREFVSWSAPDIPRDNPGVAKVLGSGVCEKVTEGVVGSGVFIWPADGHFLSGFDYDPSINHFGIDIDGQEGDPVYAADSGVVVYAGWNNWGYGYMVVINHGNGWQTLYAHLNAIYVSCGQSVEQGAELGAIGSTGNATGSQLHFEMMVQGNKVDPHNYLP